MSILLSLLLAQARVLPEIDRQALDRQARAEAQQSRRPAQRRAASAAAPQAGRPGGQPARAAVQRAAVPNGVVRSATVQGAAVQGGAVQSGGVTRRRVAAPQPAASLRLASGGPLALSEITTICRTASNQADGGNYLSTFARARSFSAAEGASLKLGCAAYLAGRADARGASRDTPGL